MPLDDLLARLTLAELLELAAFEAVVSRAPTALRDALLHAAALARSDGTTRADVATHPTASHRPPA